VHACAETIISAAPRLLFTGRQRGHDTQHDRDHCADPRGGGRHEQRQHETDQDGADDQPGRRNADPAHDQQCQAPVEPGRFQGRGEEQRPGHQDDGGGGEADEHLVERSRGRQRRLGGHAQRLAVEPADRSRGQDDRAGRRRDALAHPQRDRENQQRQRDLTGGAERRRGRQQQHADEQSEGKDEVQDLPVVPWC